MLLTIITLLLWIKVVFFIIEVIVLQWNQKLFEKDILPKGKHDDLSKHIREQRENFASASSDYDISDSIAGKNGYNYIIDTDRGINTVKFFGERHPFPEQKEFSIPNGIKIRK